MKRKRDIQIVSADKQQSEDELSNNSPDKHPTEDELSENSASKNSHLNGSLSATDSSSSSSIDTDEEIQQAKMKKKSKSKSNDPSSFVTSITKILRSHIPKSERAVPIMSRSRHVEESIDREAEITKQQRISRCERRILQQKDRIRKVNLVGEYEKTLKNVAQRGVVKLFNAIHAAQGVASGLNANEGDSSSKNAKNAAHMSKTTFLEKIKLGAIK